MMVLNSILVAVVLLGFLSLCYLQKKGAIDLLGLITARNGQIHRPAIQEFGVFLIMSWGFVVLINRGAVPEWYVAAYVAAFVLRAGHAAWLTARKHEDQTTETGKQQPSPPSSDNP